MTQEQFIKEIAKYVQKYAPKYGLMCNSAIIAQACLESSYGTSTKAKYHNYFGLKYRENRVNCNNGYFYDGGSEQNADGSYTLLPSATAWYAFDDMEHGVEGYCQFVNISNYKSIKGITDPLKYLQAIRDCNYATSLNYVSNVYKVVEKWNLTQYDTVQNTTTTVSKNSPLATYKKISPNKTSPRNHVIDTITIHCYVGQVSVESAGNWFAKSSAQCSCNYVIGADGRIGLIVDEGDRSWCTSSASNDNRAITIECASNTSHPYAVNDKVMKSLIELCADICKRNNIKELKWKGDKSLIGQVDKQNMTVHRWFKNKACPGEFLYERHGYIAAEVNKRLGVYSNTSNSSSSTQSPATTTNLYRVRKSWTDVSSQTGAYSSLENAKKNCKSGYSVFDKDGNCVYSNVPQTSTSTKLYRVQTGSFALEKNAIALQKRLKKAGFDSIIKKSGILYKVQVGAYSTKENSEEMKKKLQAKGFNAFIVYS